MGLDLKGKWQAIDQIAHLITDSKSGVSLNDLVDADNCRDHESSTCIGHGLMIPHGTISDECLLTGGMAISEEGWGLGAQEGPKIHCVLLLATPDVQASRHLAILAAFTRLFMSMPELRGKLIAAKTPAEAHSIIGESGSLNFQIESRPTLDP